MYEPASGALRAKISDPQQALMAPPLLDFVIFASCIFITDALVTVRIMLKSYLSFLEPILNQFPIAWQAGIFP